MRLVSLLRGIPVNVLFIGGVASGLHGYLHGFDKFLLLFTSRAESSLFPLQWEASGLVLWERRDLDIDVLNDYGYLLKDLFELKTDGAKCINLINLNRGNVGSSSLIVELASLKKCISAM